MIEAAVHHESAPVAADRLEIREDGHVQCRSLVRGSVVSRTSMSLATTRSCG
jgi:hypothetical protein